MMLATASSGPRSHPRMPRDPIRMLARVTRSRQPLMNPTLLRERGAVVDDEAHQGVTEHDLQAELDQVPGSWVLIGAQRDR